MSRKSLGQWCKSVLPENFDRVSGQSSAIQEFLVKQLPEPINQQVQVINCSAEQITIAVTDPQVANYLRLYLVEVRQQIRESLGLEQNLVIKTMPESMLKIDVLPPLKRPEPVSKEAVDAITKNASWIEDDDLRQSLQSLAKVLKKG
jgi:hypothetical protein